MVKSYNIFLIFFASQLWLGCAESENEAQKIIDQSIEAYGGELYNNFSAEFDFRDKHYVVSRNDGKYQYERIFEDSLGDVKDVLSNSSFSRYINDEEIEVDQEWTVKYSNSVNSVAYFALLPFGLNDPAVIKEYLGEVKLKDRLYHKIKVTFSKSGGGKDFEDEFIYWIDKEDYSMDYLAYLYHTDGGGTRFREAFNQRNVNGIIFADYHNYKFDGIENIASYDSLFMADKLEKVSEIILENVTVNTN